MTKETKHPSLQETLVAAERLYVCDLLVITSGSVVKAAKLAGVHRVQLWRIITAHGIKPRDYAPKIEARAESSVKWLGMEMASQ